MSDTTDYRMAINVMTDEQLVNETIRMARLAEDDAYWENGSEVAAERLELCRNALLKRMNPEILIR